MARLSKRIHTQNTVLNAVIDIGLAVIFAVLCIAILAFGAAALESQVFGLLTWIAIYTTPLFLLSVIVISAYRVYDKSGDSNETPAQERDVISELRRKYAHDEISEEELEYRIEQSLEEKEEEKRSKLREK